MSCRKYSNTAIQCSASAMLQKFPNSGKYPEQSRKWLHSINDRDINEMDPVMVYRSKRVCRKHFEAKYHSSMLSRLQPITVPTLYLQDEINLFNPDEPSTSSAMPLTLVFFNRIPLMKMLLVV
nr:uncharacterized protein LOC111509507 [Leptinotarsa decemlineata]